MDMPSNVFRLQQQSWTPNNASNNISGGRLVAYNNCGYMYTNSAYGNSLATTNLQQFSPTEHSNKYIVSPSLNPKKGNQQKFDKWPSVRREDSLVSIKSKIGVEYRRYSVPRANIVKFDDFSKKIESIHHLNGTSFVIYYCDLDGEMLPINNDDNLAKAINSATRIKTSHIVATNNNSHPTAIHPHHMPPHFHHTTFQRVFTERPFLKLFLETKSNQIDFNYPSGLALKFKKKDNLITMLIPSSASSSSDSRPLISMPEDFRQVSSIIDADKLPATRRRVVLKRGGSDKPLGFYIRDGTYHRMNSRGMIEKTYGIFISRLVPGGLAESTNLLAENDEILEVNGIEVGQSKRLDQVRDMMVANSSNLIITTRPAKPCSHYSTGYQNRHRLRTKTDFPHRDRLSSTQSTGSDLGEDFVRHHIN